MPNPTPPDTANILGEITLYYDEVRDINVRTLSLGKFLALIALALTTYTLFGLQTVLDQKFWTTVKANLLPIRAATKVYCGLGLLFSIGLYSVCCLAILQLGHSKCFKHRYWRSVAVLREKLHDWSTSSRKPGEPLIPLQTGLEQGPHKMFPGLISRPFVKNEDFFIGYCLGFVNLFVLIAPSSIFIGIWQYSNEGFEGNFGTCLGSAFSDISPLLAFLAIFDVRATVEYCRGLKIAQLITPQDPYPTIPDSPLSSRTRRRLNRFVIILVCTGIILLLVSFLEPASLWPLRLCLATFLIGGVIVHRILVVRLGRRSAGANAYRAVFWMIRIFGVQRQHERTTAVLLWVPRVDEATLTRWRAEAHL